jgi:integrase
VKSEQAEERIGAEEEWTDRDLDWYSVSAKTLGERSDGKRKKPAAKRKTPTRLPSIRYKGGGGIWPRGDKWVGRAHWKGERKWIGTHETRSAARIAHAGALKKLQEARPTGASETCDGFANRWVADYRPKAAPATARTYRYALQPFAREFKGVKLADVDRPEARRWANAQPKGNVAVVRSMFFDALRDGLVTTNPFANLRLEGSRGRKHLKPPTVEDVEKLARVAVEVHGEYGHTFRALILTAAYTAARPGELFALEWPDVDLKNRRVHISKSLDGTGQVKLPKNGQDRVVFLPTEARDALMGVRVEGPLVFTTKTGRQFSKSQFNLYWSPVRAAFGRPRMHFYELRHFGATHMLELGLTPSDVAHQLGHTDGGRLVASLYGHPERSAMSRIEQAFGGAGAPLRRVEDEPMEESA